MNDIILFWSLVLLVAIPLAVLRDVLGDDPRGSASYSPPRSHHDDEFARTGSSWR